MDNNQVIGVVFGTIFFTLIGWEFLKFFTKILLYYMINVVLANDEPELPPKINPDHFQISPAGNVTEKVKAFSIEPHGPEGEYVLYQGRDADHHGANLCTLSNFDRGGVTTRRAIEDSLNRSE